jgi:hypothetical protein
MRAQRLVVPDWRLAIVRLPPDAEVPRWARNGPLQSATRTPAELSVVCEDAVVPEGLTASRGWRVLAVEGPLPFELTGVLQSLAQPLADAGISCFVIATYDTDYLLVKEEWLAAAVGALRGAGHQVDAAT